jgi:hypothetical protein
MPVDYKYILFNIKNDNKFKLLIIKLFLNKINSKFMNIYEKEIYSNLILEHFFFHIFILILLNIHFKH